MKKSRMWNERGGRYTVLSHYLINLLGTDRRRMLNYFPLPSDTILNGNNNRRTRPNK